MLNQPEVPETNKILVVDDSKYNSYILKSILNTEGYEVVIARDGDDAFNKAIEEQPDLILMDVIMPKLDGFGACEKIRKEKKTQSIPIIFLTARDDKESTLKGFEKGGQDYLKKPYYNHELLARVKTQLKLRKYARELETVNTTLEKAVNERTKELSKANEELEILNNKLLDFDMAKMRFLNLISHEIRTPLNGIIGFTKLLKNKLQSTEYEVYFNQLEKSSLRLENFAIKALLITELQSGSYYLTEEKIKLKPFCERVLRLFKDEIENKSIKIKLTVDDPQKEIKAEKYLLEKALYDIIDNAIKYSRDGGEVNLKVYQNNNDKTIIEVEDFGVGFSAEAKNFLFNHFAIGKDPVNKEWGISLSFVKLYMDAQSGEVTIDTERSKGVKVKLLFNS